MIVRNRGDGDMENYDTETLKAHIASRMWVNGIVGSMTEQKEQVAEAFSDSAPAWFAESAIEEMVDEGIVKDDHEGIAGWPPESISLSAQPDQVRDYIVERDESRLSWDLREMD